MLLQCLPSSFSLISFTVWVEMSFEEFQDSHHGSHHGIQNRMILAILNLYVALMPHIKFKLNLTYGFGGAVVWRILRWLPWWPSWILERKDFSNFESLCYCDASYQVLAQSHLRFGRRWSSWGPSWISEQNNFSNSESPYCHKASH